MYMGQTIINVTETILIASGARARVPYGALMWENGGVLRWEGQFLLWEG